MLLQSVPPEKAPVEKAPVQKAPIEVSPPVEMPLLLLLRRGKAMLLPDVLLVRTVVKPDGWPEMMLPWRCGDDGFIPSQATPCNHLSGSV